MQIISSLYVSSPCFYWERGYNWFSFFLCGVFITTLPHPDERIAVGWWFHRSSRASFPCSLPLSSFTLCAVIAAETSPSVAHPETDTWAHLRVLVRRGKKKRKKNPPQSLRRRLVFICKGMNRTVVNPKLRFRPARCILNTLERFSWQYSHFSACEEEKTSNRYGK